MNALNGLLISATRIGKAEAGAALARNDTLHQTEAAIERQCIRNQFFAMAKVKFVCHPAVNSADEKQLKVIDSLIDDATILTTWTFGQSCAWFSGERDGYQYAVYFKPNVPGRSVVRITLDEIAHACEDCM